jgi:hypothetical protein
MHATSKLTPSVLFTVVCLSILSLSPVTQAAQRLTVVAPVQTAATPSLNPATPSLGPVTPSVNAIAPPNALSHR